mmetsp:Transcript_17706/g.41567  ORF Transcript_17706/g.41567 Transcript_17706/m.41567 type:complete len:223 (+) Transcript_17706:658-1326(+)
MAMSLRAEAPPQSPFGASFSFSLHICGFCRQPGAAATVPERGDFLFVLPPCTRQGPGTAQEQGTTEEPVRFGERAESKTSPCKPPLLVVVTQAALLMAFHCSSSNAGMCAFGDLGRYRALLRHQRCNTPAAAETLATRTRLLRSSACMQTTALRRPWKRLRPNQPAMAAAILVAAQFTRACSNHWSAASLRKIFVRPMHTWLLSMPPIAMAWQTESHAGLAA